MPTTPNYAIDFPCEGSSVSLADFQMLAQDTENALVTVDATATGATHRPFAAGHWFSLNPAVGVETAALFTAITVSSSNVTVNSATGTMTIVTPGIYRMGVATSGGAQSSLTMTSQRASIFKNGVFVLTKRYRGTNPTGLSCIGGSYTTLLNLVAGDVITVSYFWTGTGSLAAAGGSTGEFDLAFLYSA